MDICRQIIIDKTSPEKITDKVSFCFDPDETFNFEERYLRKLLALFRQTLMKLQTFLATNNQEASFLTGREGLGAGWYYINDFQDDSGTYCGPVGIARFYYEKHPQKAFLFGTAYQFLRSAIG